MGNKDKIIVLNDYRATAQDAASESVSAESVSDVSRESRDSVQTGRVVRKKKLRVKRLKTIGAVLCTCVLLFFISGLPIFQIQTITVTGNDALTAEKVIALSGIRQGDNLFRMRTGAVEDLLEHNPFVEKADIRRRLPDGITIALTERKSVGYIVTRDGYVQVAADGRLLAIQQSLSDYRLPVISGIGLDELPELGGIIQNEKLKQALEILQNCDAALLDNIAELNVGQAYYILLYTNQQLEVRLGGLENMEQRLKDLNKILTEVVGTKIASDQILYIDMRYENSSAVIKVRD